MEEIKALGNLKFKEKQYDSALEAFTKGVEKAGPNSSDQIVAMLYQNRAACREKVGHSPFDILNDCMAALKVDKKYTKAYLRAAKALNDVGKKQDALACEFLKMLREKYQFLFLDLLAAFTLDSSLNKTNFEFFGKLLAIEPVRA